MYTKIQFGKELKEKLFNNLDCPTIGRWAYSVYLDSVENIDDDFENLLLTLNTMEDGPEFYFTYKELNKVSDDLIAGKNVKL